MMSIDRLRTVQQRKMNNNATNVEEVAADAALYEDEPVPTYEAETEASVGSSSPPARAARSAAISSLRL